MGEHCTASGTPDSFQLLHAVNASGEVIFMTNRDGVITFVNREFVRLYGYTAEEVVGRTTPRLLKSGCTSEETYASLWNRLEHGEMVRGDMVNRTKQGAIVHVEFSANPVRDDRNEIIGFLGIQRDVTARHRMETALRESEARYRTLAEAAHDHIFIIDVDGRYQYINAAGAALFNLRPDEVFGKKLDDCFPPDLAATVESQVQQVQRTRVPLYVEQAMQFPQGEIWQSAWLAPILDQHQQVTGVMGISRDITERRRLAALLERHDSLLNAVIESSPIGIAVLDGASFVCNTVNPAFQRLTSGRAVVGYPFKHVWPADAEDTTLTPMFKRVLSTGIPDECVDLLVQSPSSGDESCHDAWMTVTASPLLLPGSTAPDLLILATETTGRKQLEAQFFQAQKMEAVGRLAGGVAHDFNNLLTAILGYSELLRDTFDPDDRRHDDLREILRAAESAATLTRQLLTFSRKQIAESTIVDINTVVGQFEKIVRRTIGEDVALNVSLEPLVDRIKIDAGQLEQILMNLSVNARDAMPRGGTLSIQTANVDVREHKRASAHHVPSGRYAALAITDTGLGMSPDVQSHLFEPFFTTKELGKGTGLGLSTVFGIVKQHGGYIGVSSEVNRGTTFTVYFPSVDRHKDPRSEEVPIARIPIGRETVLVAEDDDPLRGLACRTLESCGYRTLAAGGVREAVQMARDFSGVIDLLVTDVVMPGEDGVELARELAQLRPEIRVLYMSGHTEGVISDRGILNRNLQFLQKPFSRLTLAHKVREVLDLRSETSGEIARCMDASAAH